MGTQKNCLNQDGSFEYPKHMFKQMDKKIWHWLKKNNDFAEFKVHLIHRKQVPLFHNTVFLLCDEGARLHGGHDIMC